MSTPFIIIPAYNRRIVTLGCLAKLKEEAILPKWNVIIVDDGSTDGTSEAVWAQYPEVFLVHGTGDLFWTGAIELGMRFAFRRGATSFVWLNDDSIVDANSLETIVSRAEECGGMVSAQGLVIIERLNFVWHHPLIYRTRWGVLCKEPDLSQQEIRVDTCRGNLVALSRKVVETIGYPDGARIPHVNGDTDYGLRASRAGISVVIIPRAVVQEGELERPSAESWLLGERSVRAIWKSLRSKRSSFYPPMYWTYSTRHWGVRGVLLFSMPYLRLLGVTILRLLIPRRLLIALYGRHSASWKALAPLKAKAETDRI